MVVALKQPPKVPTKDNRPKSGVCTSHQNDDLRKYRDAKIWAAEMPLHTVGYSSWLPSFLWGCLKVAPPLSPQKYLSPARLSRVEVALLDIDAESVDTGRNP